MSRIPSGWGDMVSWPWRNRAEVAILVYVGMLLAACLSVRVWYERSGYQRCIKATDDASHCLWLYPIGGMVSRAQR
jgi:hypothetical protein